MEGSATVLAVPVITMIALLCLPPTVGQVMFSLMYASFSAYMFCRMSVATQTSAALNEASKLQARERTTKIESVLASTANLVAFSEIAKRITWVVISATLILAIL